MARISTYTIDSSIDGTEFLLGREADGTTKQFSMSALQTFLATAAEDTTTFGTVDINGGAIDGTVIGGSTPAAGSFTTISASSNATITGNTTIGGTLGVTGVTTLVDVNVTGEINFDGAPGTAGQYLQSQGDGNTPIWDTLSLNDLSDVLIADSSLYIGHDPTATDSTAQFNLAVGVTALDAITTGDANVAIGHDALTANTTGTGAIAIGYQAGAAMTSTTFAPTFLGYQAGKHENGGLGGNTGLGHSTLSTNTTGTFNTAVGYFALNNLNTSGSDVPSANTAVGHFAGLDATFGDKGTYIGSSAGTNVTSANNNTFVGAEAGNSTTTGGDNVAVGLGSLGANTTNVRNTAVGTEALNFSTAAENVAIGYRAGYGVNGQTNSATQNTFVGFEAGTVATTGGVNTAIGYRSLKSNTVGTSNTALGYLSLQANVQGTGSVGIGAHALGQSNPATASNMNNTAVGTSAGQEITTGTNNVVIGYQTADAMTTGSGNTIIGYDANPSANAAVNQTVIGNGATGHADNVVVVGNAAVTAIHPGDDNGVDLGSTAYSFKDAYIQGSLKIGDTSGSTYFQFPTTTGTTGQVLQVPSSGNLLEWGDVSSSSSGVDFISQDTSLLVGHLTAPSGTAEFNVGLGLSALDSLTDGDNNTAMGHLAGTALTTGAQNVFIGSEAGQAISSGLQNVAIGFEALAASGNPSKAVAIGYEALTAVSVQFPNSVAVGYQAGQRQTSGTDNTFLGYRAGANGQSFAKNTVVGSGALYNEIVGQENVAIGYNALAAQTSASASNSKNVAVGSQAGVNNTDGYFNVFLGTLAGNTNTTGDNNIVIGYNAEKSSATTDNEIVIGSAGAGLGANSTVIGNTSTLNTKIFGLRTPLTSLTSGDVLTPNDSGQTFVFADSAATITLPNAAAYSDLTGVYFHFIALDDTVGDKIIQCPDNVNDDLIGGVTVIDVDDDSTVSFAVQVSDEFHKITFNGTTTGRGGSKVTVTNIATNKWHVEGTLLCSGTPATPFS